jgi:hypothetical protein
MRQVFTLLLLMCSGCGRVPVRTELVSSITQAISGGDSTVVDLGTLADFAWDEVCFLGPFMKPADISAKVGFEWKGKRSGAGGSLVFVDVRAPRSDSVATGHVPIRRSQWFIQASGCIARVEAKFLVRARDGGPATLVPVHRNPQQRPVAPFL